MQLSKSIVPRFHRSHFSFTLRSSTSCFHSLSFFISNRSVSSTSQEVPSAVSSGDISLTTQRKARSDMQNAISVRENIVLNDAERELLSTLMEAAKQAGATTILRCAGGWVRDKLLGLESMDIDVALDNMMGKDFAELVNQYLTTNGKEAGRTAVIHSNPDQSKHLETARMRVNEVWIDLVNLRSETYAKDSRIPTIEFGTAEQDAMRRDFTINSMFYNVNEGVVEDLTGQGRDDLKARIIRTPLQPMETFMDDPLRVLRAIRFGTRFGFELERSLIEAASSTEVCQALGNKVSKERIGTELEGMINGPAPVASVRLLDHLGLFSTVFALPEAQQAKLPSPSVYGTACCNCMEAAADLAAELELVPPLDKEERRFLLMSGLLMPFRQFQVPLAKGKSTPATTHIIRESIKWRSKDAEMTVLLHDSALELLSIQQHFASSPGPDIIESESRLASGSNTPRVALGLIIRKLKQHWRLVALLSPVLGMSSATPIGVEGGQQHVGGQQGAPHSSGDLDGELGIAAHNLRLDQTKSILAAAAAYGLEDCWQWKPLMDGKQVMALLGMTKPGPELGRAVADVMEWQLANPGGTLSDCEQHIKSKWAK